MNDFSGTYCSQVTVALICKDYGVRVGYAAYAGCDRGRPAVGRLMHIAVKIVICKYGAADRGNADGTTQCIHFFKRFGYQLMNYAVGTAGTVMQLNKAKKAIQKAFRLQQEGAGFTFVEVLACCPTNWGKTPIAAVEWLKENMIPYYPLGVYKDITAEGQ